MPRLRTTIYTAVYRGEIVHNVWSLDRVRVEREIADRKANGTGFPDEYVRRVALDWFNDKRREAGFPAIFDARLHSF